MKVNMEKVDRVVIEDKDGKFVTDFALLGASYVQHSLTGNTLTLRKKV